MSNSVPSYAPEYNELYPLQPKTYSLGSDQQLHLYTGSGGFIVSIKTTDRGVAIESNTGSTIDLDGLTIYTLGTEELGKEFFGPSGIFISRNHLEIQINKIQNGKVELKLTDLDSRNGTTCRYAETELPLVTPTMPVIAPIQDVCNQVQQVIPPELSRRQPILISGGAEGTTESPNGKCRAITVAGPRARNEDGSLVLPDAIAIADGMGGHSHGQEASKIALDLAGRHVQDRIIHLSQIFHVACCEISFAQLGLQSGTTLAIARKTILHNGKIRYELAHVGDTKIIAFSRKTGKTIYESEDQTPVQEKINRKILKPIDRYASSENNKIYNPLCACGLHDDPGYNEIEGDPGDLVIVIYTDGVSDYVTPEEAKELYLKLHSASNTKHYHEELIKLALSRQQSPEGFDIQLNGINNHITIKEDHGDNASAAFME